MAIKPTVEVKPEDIDLTLEDSEFNFDNFYTEEEQEEPEEDISNVDIVMNDEEAIDEIVDLDSKDVSISIDAEFPYIRVSGFIINQEIAMLKESLERLHSKLKSRYSEEDMISIMFNINNDDYVITKLPLTLDTMLTLLKYHKYKVELVKSESNTAEVTSNLMKAFIFA